MARAKRDYVIAAGALAAFTVSWPLAVPARQTP